MGRGPRYKYVYRLFEKDEFYDLSQDPFEEKNVVDDKRYKKQPFGKRFTSFITPFNKIELEDSELSEDYSFCYRWTEFCQGKIYAATARRIRHMGQLVVETSYADRLGVLVK